MCHSFLYKNVKLKSHRDFEVESLHSKLSQAFCFVKLGSTEQRKTCSTKVHAAHNAETLKRSFVLRELLFFRDSLLKLK